MELTIETNEKLVDLNEVESMFNKGVNFFKEILDHKNYAEKHQLFSAQFSYEHLKNFHTAIINDVASIEKLKKWAAEYKEKAEYYRKLISPFLDGTEEERISSFLNLSRVLNGISIENAFKNYDSYKSQFDSCVRRINKKIRLANNNFHWFESCCYIPLKNVRNKVLKNYNESQKTVETVELNSITIIVR